jgi:hypothetical protein
MQSLTLHLLPYVRASPVTIDCEARVGDAIAVALRLRLGIPDDEICAPTRPQIIDFIDSLDDEGKERLRDVAESLEWVVWEKPHND